MGGLECVITGLMDEFNYFFKQFKHAREIFTLIVILLSFSVGVINVTPVSYFVLVNNMTYYIFYRLAFISFIY